MTETNEIGKNRVKIVRPGDLLAEWQEIAENARECMLTGRPLGVTTGLKTLDTYLGGFLRPGLHSLQGDTGTGKTALALQMACECGFPAVFVSCEMSPIEILLRITARVTGMFKGRFTTGELTAEESLALVCQGIQSVPDLVIVDSTMGHMPAFATDPNDRINIYDTAITARGESKHVFVVLDSVHAWAPKAFPGRTEYEYLNAAFLELGALASAAALNCPILAIAEMNRASKKDGGTSAGAGSRKIEYTGETVMALHVDENSIDAIRGEKDIDLKISKNRNGGTGRPLRLRFSGPLMKFWEV